MGIVQAIFVPAEEAGPLGRRRERKLFNCRRFAPQVQLRVVVHGCDTVLGTPPPTPSSSSRPASRCSRWPTPPRSSTPQRRQRRWDPTDTGLHAAEALEDERLREGNNEKLAAGKPLSYIYRTSYLPLKGMFQILPADLGLGKPVANEPAPEKGLARGKAAVKAKDAAAAPQSTSRRTASSTRSATPSTCPPTPSTPKSR